jgi:hypothetical protein
MDRRIFRNILEFNSKNKFEKLVHPVGFIIRIYHDARSPERQMYLCENQLHVSAVYSHHQAELRTVIRRIIIQCNNNVFRFYCIVF